MKKQTAYSMAAGALILVFGFVAMVVLFQFREPPAEASTKYQERTRQLARDQFVAPFMCPSCGVASTTVT